jgi:S1-C subfamily serine protease
MDNRPNFIVRCALASAMRTVRQIGEAIALGLGLAAGSIAHAGVPLPVVAETTGIPSLAAVVKRIAPSVVNIEGRARLAAAPATKRGQTGKGIALAARDEIRTFGSGVVFDSLRGLIITNSHLVDHADEIKVKLTDGRALPARRVGADPETDVAVIQVRADGLTELPFGNSDRLEVGDFVFAIGNPLEIGQTVTAGMVSGLHRTNVGLGPYEDFIQTDAAIYPGNSGGALVDLRGDLVGINTAFMAVRKNNPGMSFAIPINMASALVDQMLEFGDIRRGVLGLTYDDFTSARSRSLAGAVVREVDPRSAAERAGLKPGDLVMELGGKPVRDGADLRIRLALLRAGEVAELAVWRPGGTLIVRAHGDGHKGFRAHDGGPFTSDLSGQDFWSRDGDGLLRLSRRPSRPLSRDRYRRPQSRA